MARKIMAATAGSDLTLPVSPARDHIQGSPTAIATLVEYGDFECPHCLQAHELLPEVQAYFKDQLRLVFRHFPLSSVHPHAQRAAEAAEAAAAQDQFWPMHDLLFAHQEALEDDDLVDYAAALGLDTPRFEQGMATQRYTPRVREDFMSGVRSGVGGTPTFFINGQRHQGPWDPESLIAAIKPSTIPHPQRPHAGR